MEFFDDTIRVRALEARDLEHMRAWINDPETSRFLSFSWPVSSEGQKAWFARVGGSSNKQKFFIETLDGQPIGVLSLTNIDTKHRSTEIGITIGARENRGKGFASRTLRVMLENLFEKGGYHRVWATIIEPNEASLRLFEHVGFKREGLRREDTWWEGRYVGTHTLSILSHEYHKATP